MSLIQQKELDHKIHLLKSQLDCTFLMVRF